MKKKLSLEEIEREIQYYINPRIKNMETLKNQLVSNFAYYFPYNSEAIYKDQLISNEFQQVLDYITEKEKEDNHGLSEQEIISELNKIIDKKINTLKTRILGNTNLCNSTSMLSNLQHLWNDECDKKLYDIYLNEIKPDLIGVEVL
jgi:hypothetical protein